MGDIFISHVEEDAEIALEMAISLEREGYTTWCYEVNGVIGSSYLKTEVNAIKQARCVVVIISPNSINSNQVTKEVVEAHKKNKAFIPIRRDITNKEFQEKQPEWGVAMGATTSKQIPKGGVSDILTDIIDGLKALDIQPSPIDTTRIDRVAQKLKEFRPEIIEPPPEIIEPPPRHVESQIKVLKEGNTVQERGDAAAALGRIKDLHAVEPLIERLLDADEKFEVRGRVAKALGELGDKRAIGQLIKVLENKQNVGFVRAWAAWSLGQLDDIQAFRPLINILDDEDEGVRLSAVEALGEFCGEEGANALREAITDQDEDVRNESVTSVLRLSERLLKRIDKYGVDISGASKELGNAKDAVAKKKFEEVFEYAKKARKIAGEALKIAKPDISVIFPLLTSELEIQYSYLPVTIANEGSINATDINIKWIKKPEVIDVYEDNIILNSIEPSKSKKEYIHIRPMKRGKLPITIECSYTDSLGVVYQTKSVLTIPLVTPTNSSKLGQDVIEQFNLFYELLQRILYIDRENIKLRPGHKLKLLDELREAINTLECEKILLYLENIQRSDNFPKQKKVEDMFNSLKREIETMYNKHDATITEDCQKRAKQFLTLLQNL